MAANWKAITLWKDPGYLKEQIGSKREDEKFPVFVARDNLRFLAKDAVDIDPMTLNELIDRIFCDNNESKNYIGLVPVRSDAVSKTRNAYIYADHLSTR